MHMVTKIQQLQTTGEEGVELLVNEPFENEEWSVHLQNISFTKALTYYYSPVLQFIGELSNNLICERFQD